MKHSDRYVGAARLLMEARELIAPIHEDWADELKDFALHLLMGAEAMREEEASREAGGDRS